ncbi:MAG: metallophosphoesterase [Opitutaceae bacterium]|nr:metallophosphoesterase [Cephaloticoccus sp.]MCP5530019.1 metallophosphoesterase [Opitutaceae bacterium]
MSDSDTWRFVHVTDIHLGSTESYRFNPAFGENWETAAEQIRALAPDLLLVGGDITRDGNLHAYEFDRSRAALDALGIPWHCVPGNMDTGNKHTDRQGARDDRDDLACNVTEAQLQTYRDKIGPTTWSFVHRGVRFSGCYEIIADTTLPSARALDAWLQNLATLPRCAQHVMLNHYPLFTDTPDDPPRDITDPSGYLDWYFSAEPAPRRKLIEAYRSAGVTHVLSGHIHCRRPPLNFEGMNYCFGASTAFAQWKDRWSDGDARLGFQVFTVTPDGIDYRFEPLSHVSTRTDGWGPGGHPKPEARRV